MLFMLIGHFRRTFASARSSSPIEAQPSPPDLKYFGSWVDVSLSRCFQVVDCDDLAALQRWAARWRHCVDFELVPIVPAPDAVAALEPLLD
jgi:hypothetical protein